ncbi:protein NO VEIN domain-containing protein, partial [Pseudomonas syringae]
VEYIDVKSTFGAFEQKIHISINELLHMRDLSDYKLYRVYSVEGKKAKLRISSSLQFFASDVLKRIDPIVSGVRVDNISVSTDVLDFGDEIDIEIFSLA